jgi:hypothetical protein
VNRTVVLLLVLVIAALAGTAVGARRHAAVWRAAGGPSALPAALHAGGTRAAWVFVRRGCRHCDAHLGALADAAAALPDSVRPSVLARIHVVGPAAGVPPGVVREADSLRTRLGVRLAPTTWLVDADGRVWRAWRGARGRDAWRGALDFLAAAP